MSKETFERLFGPVEDTLRDKVSRRYVEKVWGDWGTYIDAVWTDLTLDALARDGREVIVDLPGRSTRSERRETCTVPSELVDYIRSLYEDEEG